MDARSRSLRKYGLTLLDYDEMVKTGHACSAGRAERGNPGDTVGSRTGVRRPRVSGTMRRPPA
jgi:hypothetical protein